MRCLRLCLFAVVCVAFFSSVSAQNSIAGSIRNTFTNVKDGNENPDIAFSIAHSFEKSKWSVAGYCDMFKNWGEVYVGPRYAPNSWLTVSAYAGLENWENWWRVAGDINIAYKAINFYNVYEYGASKADNDYWFSDLTYALNSAIKVEAKAYNIGPVYKTGGGVIVAIPKTPLSISPIVLYNFDTKKVEEEAMLYFAF